MNDISEVTSGVTNAISDVNDYVIGLSPVVIDIIVAALILAVALVYAKRGIYQMAATGLVLVLSVAIGLVVSNAVLNPVVDWAWDKYGQTYSDNFDSKVAYVTEGKFDFSEDLRSSWNEFIDSIDSDKLDSLHMNGYDDYDLFDEQVVINLKAYTLVRTKLYLTELAHFALFGLTFAVALLLLTFIKNTIGTLAKLPVIRWVDKLGGLLVGGVGCIFVMMIITRAAGMLGITFFQNLSQGTVILNWLSLGDIQGAISWIQSINLQDLQSIDVQEIMNEYVSGYDNPSLTESFNQVNEFVKGLDAKQLEEFVSRASEEAAKAASQAQEIAGNIVK